MNDDSDAETARVILILRAHFHETGEYKGEPKDPVDGEVLGEELRYIGRREYTPEA